VIKVMEPVIQQEATGCAIASVAALARISYEEAKTTANGMGIYAKDPDLWSETEYLRRLLTKLSISAGKNEIAFTSWKTLPDCALLAVKWSIKNSKPYWHWVVFIREGDREYVLDSKKSLKKNIRTDFWRMHPKWFIEIND
jgi:hypothetical protein